MRYSPMALIALVACGTRKDAPPDTSRAQLDSMNQVMAKLGGASQGHHYGAPTGKIRVAHMFELQGQPAGPVDIYDVRNPDSTTKPLISNLAYGQVSDYVSPRGADPGARSNLYLFEAGKKQGTNPYGTNMDNSGFEATDQMTIALGPSKSMNGQAIGSTDFVEAGARNPHWIDSARTVPTGQALLVALQANVNADSLPYFYLVVDGKCPLATNDPRAKIPMAMGTEQHYLVTPGTHSLGVVTAPSGVKDCNGKTPVGTSTVNVAAGQHYIVFLFGQPSDGLKTLAIPFS
jgi:hypothetical protein